MISNLKNSLNLVQNYLNNFAKDSLWNDKLAIGFDNNYEIQIPQNLIQAWHNGDFTSIPNIEIIPAATLNGANSSFAKEKNTIFLSQQFIETNPIEVIAQVLLEEFAHKIDSVINIQDGVGSEYFTQFKVEDGAAIVNAVSTTKIIDKNTATGIPNITVADVVVDEISRQALFTVVLDKPNTQNVSVNYTSRDGSAIANVDYQSVNGSISFAPGETAKTIPVFLIDDFQTEVSESFKFQLSNPINGNLLDSLAIATIGPSDGNTTGNLPTISVQDIVVGEADGTATFVLTLNHPSANVVSLKVNTFNQTTINSDDLKHIDYLVSFAPGQTTQTVTVALVNNNNVETNEVFGLSLTSSTNALIVDTVATATIIDNFQSQGFNFQIPTNNPLENIQYIRDFDGNDLGQHDRWKNIGSIDVQGDGDLEYVFLNPAIGRWATVGVDFLTGAIDFSNHSWGGDTRIVGIYEDPLVKSGVVVKGSDFDSQRRFQNDLFIDNLTLISNSDRDYDGDGLQEIYFRVNDGTSVLHAYMHADGNIQYANYQSKDDLTQFMNSHSIDTSLWSGWI